jgi:hypothetical protein
MWDEEKHPRDDLGRFTKKELADMSADELKKYVLSNNEYTFGAISGAIDPDSERGSKHAERFYEEMRHRKDDVTAIAKNTGISENDIQKIKNYIFFDEHDLLDGRKRFDPNCDMALSWQRLISGEYEDVDILMLNHELCELKLVEYGYSQDEAHIMTSREYNYAKQITLRKVKKNGST